MKTFWNVLLAILAAVVILKLLPLVVALGLILGAAIVALVTFGVGLAGTLLAVGIGLAVLLSPIWIPVLVVLGAIALVKRPATGTA